jgi:signal transduction histidine kinase
VTGLAHSAAWSLAISMAVALVFMRHRGRRRSAINEALHELRRPLQAIALTGRPGAAGSASGIEGSVRLAASALERLDRAVNGGHAGSAVGARVRCESVLRSAVGRWRPRVALSGGSLELRWWAGEATVYGDRDGIERAVDNLIVNAIEHGGPAIVVEGRRRGGRLCISVADSGSGAPLPVLPHGPLAYAGRPRSRSHRRGHGLAVVRGVAAEHDGRFVLRHSPNGSLAVLDLPLRPDDGDPPAHA